MPKVRNILFLLLCLLAVRAQATLPTLPQSTVDTTLPTGYDGTADATPADSAALTTALAAINQNAGHTWVIELTAGVTYTGNFRIPNKTGSQDVVIRTSAYASLPAHGERVATGDATNMAKIVTSNTSPAIFFNESSHDISLIGIEVTRTSSSTGQAIVMGQVDSLAGTRVTTVGQLPTRVVYDRCYIHGTNTQPTRQGISGDCRGVGIIGCYISNIHEVGADSQAFLSANSDGPFTFVNSYFEAAGENIMFGGADPLITNLVPSDITITNCDFYKPFTWWTSHATYAGTAWTVKNLFEIKNAKRVLIETSRFTHSWAAGQAGYGVLFNVRNQSNTAPWSTCEDITFKNNIISDCSSGIQILGSDNPTSGGGYSQIMQRVLISNNRISINKTTYGGDGLFFGVGWGPGLLGDSGTPPTDIEVSHNTCINDGGAAAFFSFGGNTSTDAHNVVIQDNLTPTGTYGVFGTGSTAGSDALNDYCVSPVFDHNALVKNGAFIVQGNFPVGNFFPATNADVGYTNYAGGDYSLTSASAYHNAASDGHDIGADFSYFAPTPVITSQSSGAVLRQRGRGARRPRYRAETEYGLAP